MKKQVFMVAVVFLLCAAFLYSSPAPGFDNVADFSISLKELDGMAEKRDFNALEDVYLIINGAVASYIVTDSEPDTYTVEVELIDGEWIGVSDVFLYRSIVVFQGPEYVQKFPARRRSTPGPGEISVNSGIVVVARCLDAVNDGDTVIPVLEGYKLRTYK